MRALPLNMFVAPSGLHLAPHTQGPTLRAIDPEKPGSHALIDQGLCTRDVDVRDRPREEPGLLPFVESRRQNAQTQVKLARADIEAPTCRRLWASVPIEGPGSLPPDETPHELTDWLLHMHFRAAGTFTCSPWQPVFFLLTAKSELVVRGVYGASKTQCIALLAAYFAFRGHYVYYAARENTTITAMASFVHRLLRRGPEDHSPVAIRLGSGATGSVCQGYFCGCT